MENRRGSGIFLGVVSVATLVVAIIGATFAYFSASVTAENTVDLTAYEFDATVELDMVSPTDSAKLIPLVPDATITGATAPNTTNLLYAMNVGNTSKLTCIDDKGYQVCAVYKVSVTNNGNETINLTGTLTTTTNRHISLVGLTAEEIDELENPSTNKFTNLKYQTLTSGANGYELTEDEAVTLPDETGTIPLEGMSVTARQTVEKYFVVYLNDTNETGTTNTQNSEMGSVYKGQVTYTDSLSGSKLTGTFTVQG